MSCSSLSPAIAVAAAGMLQGTGIGVPPALSQAVSNFTSAGVVGAAQGALGAAASVIGNPLAGLGASIAPALTGVVPADIVANMSSGNLNNLAGQILKQANQIMGGGIGNFAQILSQAQGFAINSLGANQFASVANNLNLNSLGLNITSYTGMLSNGIGSIQNLSGFSNVMNNLGGLYDMKNMASLGDPGSLMKNLIDKGLGDYSDISGQLDGYGIPVDDLTNPIYKEKIISILNSVQGSQLKGIFDSLNVNISGVTNLGQVLDLQKLASPALVSSFGVNFQSLSDIGKQFSDMGASFEDGAELSRMVKSVEVVSLPRLDAFHGGKLVSDSVKNIISGSFGTGSGEYGNPKIQDLIGSVAGSTHIESLSSALTPIETISASPSGQLLSKQMQLLNDVASGIYGGGGNAILDNEDSSLIGQPCTIDSGTLADAGMSSIAIGDISETLANMRVAVENTLSSISQDTSLTEHLNALNDAYRTTASQLNTEKKNLIAAGIDITRANTAETSSIGIIYDSSYPNAPFTKWEADELFRYWKSLPLMISKGNAVALSSTFDTEPQYLDLCKGAMYLSSYLFTAGVTFKALVQDYFDNTIVTPDANTWIHSLYPSVNSFSFDINTGICHYEPAVWKADGLSEDRALAYPLTGIPNPPPTTITQSGPVLSSSLMAADSGLPNTSTAISLKGGDNSSILGLAKDLPEIGKDKMGLGIADLIQNMATDNVYGDAVKAALVEGRNKERLQSFGIIPAIDKIVPMEMPDPAPIGNVQFDNISGVERGSSHTQSKIWAGMKEDYDYTILPNSSDGWVVNGTGTITMSQNSTITVSVTTPNKYGAVRVFTVLLNPKNSNSPQITSNFTVAVRPQRVYIDPINFVTKTNQEPNVQVDSDRYIISGIDETEGVYLDAGDLGGNILVINSNGVTLQDFNPGDTGEVVGTVGNGSIIKLRIISPDLGQERTVKFMQIVQTTGEIRQVGSWTVRSRLA